MGMRFCNHTQYKESGCAFHVIQQSKNNIHPTVETGRFTFPFTDGELYPVKPLLDVDGKCHLSHFPSLFEFTRSINTKISRRQYLTYQSSILTPIQFIFA